MAGWNDWFNQNFGGGSSGPALPAPSFSNDLTSGASGALTAAGIAPGLGPGDTAPPPDPLAGSQDFGAANQALNTQLGANLTSSASSDLSAAGITPGASAGPNIAGALAGLSKMAGAGQQQPPQFLKLQPTPQARPNPVGLQSVVQNLLQRRQMLAQAQAQGAPAAIGRPPMGLLGF